MNNAELKTGETMAAYREKIICRINDIDNMNFLEFINNMLDAFKRSGGYDMKKYNELDREECIKAISDIMSKTSELWILWEIYRFSVNMTESEKGGAA